MRSAFQVARWLEDYGRAWTSKDPARLRALFTKKISSAGAFYRTFTFVASLTTTAASVTELANCSTVEYTWEGGFLVIVVRHTIPLASTRPYVSARVRAEYPGGIPEHV